MKPTRSAKRTVTSLRSAVGAARPSRSGGPGVPLVAGAAAWPDPARGVPHSPQNFAAGGFCAPHCGQPGARRVPHSTQKRRPASFWVPQFPQRNVLTSSAWGAQRTGPRLPLPWTSGSGGAPVGPLVFNTSGGVLGTARWVRLPCTPATQRGWHGRTPGKGACACLYPVPTARVSGVCPVPGQTPVRCAWRREMAVAQNTPAPPRYQRVPIMDGGLLDDRTRPLGKDATPIWLRHRMERRSGGRAPSAVGRARGWLARQLAGPSRS